MCHNLVLSNKEEIESFIKAIEQSEKYDKPIPKTNSHYVTEDEAEEMVKKLYKANVEEE